jgi:hypothetical protein
MASGWTALTLNPLLSDPLTRSYNIVFNDLSYM